MKIAPAIVLALFAVFTRSAAKPVPKAAVLVIQTVPDGAMDDYRERQNLIENVKVLSQSNGFATEEPMFYEILGRVLQGVAVTKSKPNTPIQSGESVVHQRSAAAQGMIHSIRQGVVLVTDHVL